MSGVVVMGIAYLFQQGREDGCAEPCVVSAPRKRVGVVIGVGTLVGGLIGTVVGNTKQRERWQPVDSRAIQVEVSPRTAMVSIGI